MSLAVKRIGLELHEHTSLFDTYIDEFDSVESNCSYVVGFYILSSPLLVTDFAAQNLSLFVLHILSVPGFVLHINSLTPEAYDVFVRERLCSHVITYLSESSQNQKLILDGLEGSYALCLIANLIHLSLLEIEVLVEHCEEFCIVVSKLLDRLGGYVGRKKSNLTSWHPILGCLQAAVPHVTSQLRLLWHGRMVRLLFADLYEQEDLDGTQNPVATASPTSGQSRSAVIAAASKPISSLKESQKRPARIRPSEQTVTERRSVEVPIYPHHHSRNGLGPEDLPQSIKAVCMLYCFTIGSLKEIRNDILAGSCHLLFTDSVSSTHPRPFGAILISSKGCSF
ncbi:unnamed protein product [Dibothriocephalus latus]|uniref:Uncharacterized protein n=1 Tax=Dibothriocephalus latus TaxID=60516 RepID=A0A3P7LI49_DIBLA|nr:unnamed protein product [Dibothriocephalus latus]